MENTRLVGQVVDVDLTQTLNLGLDFAILDLDFINVSGNLWLWCQMLPYLAGHLELAL